MAKEKIKLVEVTPENLRDLPCCGIKNTEHEGHRGKAAWLRDQLMLGLKARVLLTEDDRQFGYIECLPGEYAWRGVEAKGYMFIHCLWTFYKKYQRRGYGRFLVQSCIDDARKAQMKGAAVVARKKPWLAESSLFKKMGFEVVDTAPPDYELLVKKFTKSAANPKFKTDWEKKLKKYAKGLTIIRTDHCPHSIKFASDISEFAQKTNKMKPRILVLKTYREAQNAPTPYAIFSVILDGQIIVDHQISRSRFRNIMNKLRPITKK